VAWDNIVASRCALARSAARYSGVRLVAAALMEAAFALF